MTNVYLYMGRNVQDIPRRSFFKYVLDDAGISYHVIAPHAPIMNTMQHITEPAVIAGNLGTRQALVYETAEDVIRFADTRSPRGREYAGIAALASK